MLNGNPDKEIKQLEQLITVGSKIGENTTKYKSEFIEFLQEDSIYYHLFDNLPF